MACLGHQTVSALLSVRTCTSGPKRMPQPLPQPLLTRRGRPAPCPPAAGGTVDSARATTPTPAYFSACAATDEEATAHPCAPQPMPVLRLGGSVYSADTVHMVGAAFSLRSGTAWQCSIPCAPACGCQCAWRPPPPPDQAALAWLSCCGEGGGAEGGGGAGAGQGVVLHSCPEHATAHGPLPACMRPSHPLHAAHMRLHAGDRPPLGAPDI